MRRAQFTRNPDALKGALLKIAGYGGSRIVRADVSRRRTCCSRRGSEEPRFQTHPPIAERIWAELDPALQREGTARG